MGLAVVSNQSSQRRLNRHDMQTKILEPVVQDGLDYWKAQPASLDGVLGMYDLHDCRASVTLIYIPQVDSGLG